jgi:transaldolase
VKERLTVDSGLSDLNIKIFADGADPEGIRRMSANPLISGFTTNPTLMRKANVRNYREFAAEVLRLIDGRPVSFEVFADDFTEMETQAVEIASWGSNVHVKIPITNTRGEPSYDLLRRLAGQGVQVNVTAILTLSQVRDAARALSAVRHGYVSVFAGRIADTGRDPLPIMEEALGVLRPYPQLELLWASPRELLNVFQANAIGCHVITASNEILDKLSLVGRDLESYSLDTVRMFFDDARKAGYTLERSVAPRHPSEAGKAAQT